MTASIKQSKPYLIGVAGGSGSGKTFFAKAVLHKLGASVCELVLQDNFYIDQSAKFDGDGGSVNFDHPDSIDFELLKTCLSTLKSGLPAQIPLYDFATHTRRPQTLEVVPKPVIIVDGILLLHLKDVRSLFNETVFFDTPERLRLARRLERDVKERARTPEGVLRQFNNQVKPMHDRFVEPSKAHATTVVCEPGQFDELLSGFIAKLRKKVRHMH